MSCLIMLQVVFNCGVTHVLPRCCIRENIPFGSFTVKLEDIDRPSEPLDARTQSHLRNFPARRSVGSNVCGIKICVESDLPVNRTYCFQKVDKAASGGLMLKKLLHGGIWFIRMDKSVREHIARMNTEEAGVGTDIEDCPNGRLH